MGCRAPEGAYTNVYTLPIFGLFPNIPKDIPLLSIVLRTSHKNIPRNMYLTKSPMIVVV